MSRSRTIPARLPWAAVFVAVVALSLTNGARRLGRRMMLGDRVGLGFVRIPGVGVGLEAEDLGKLRRLTSRHRSAAFFRRGILLRRARAFASIALMGLALSAALATPSQVQAATRTWDGGGVDNNWSTAANWSADTLPVAGDTVVFNGTSTKPATINGASVTVAVFQINAGYTGTINQAAGNTLNLTTSFTQSSGTFTGGDTAITVGGAFTLNAGGTFAGGTGTAAMSVAGALTVNAGSAFTSTSGTLTLSGAVTLAAGVFIHNSGSVVFSTNNVTLNLGGAATFNNVQFLSGTKTISAGNTMTVLGTLTMTAGAVNTGTVAAQGDIAVASTFTGGSGTLLINGGGAQAWSDAYAATADLPVVNINKPGGTLTMTGTFRTTRNWTWTAGTVSATGSTVIFAAGLTITGTHTLDAVEMRGGTVTIAAGATLTATGLVTLTSGTMATGTLAAQGNITAASGFTGGSGTLLINGGGAQLWTGGAIATSDLPVVNINKPGGTLTMTGPFRTTRNWTHTAGAMAASGSTVTFAAGLTITGSHTLDAVEIRGGTVTIAAGTTLTVTGPLNLFSGGLNTGTLAAQGNIDAQVGFTSGGTGTLLINGGGAQTLTGFHNTAAGSLPNLDINKSSGTLTLAGTIRTARNWTHTAGAMTVGGSTVIFNGTQTVAGSHTLDIVDVRGGTLTIAGGTTLTVTGPLNLFSGTLNTGTLAAQGNVDAQVGFTGGGTATLLINGSGAQTLTGFHNTAAGELPNVDINKSTGTLTIAGTLRTNRNWTHTAGAMAVAGSTVIFNGTQTIAGSHTLDAVEIRGGTVTITAGTTVTASGTVTLFSGSFGSTGTLAAQADITAASGFTGGTATLLINGSGGQQLTQAVIATSSLPVVNIAKPSGTLTMSGTFRTNRNWTYTSGALNAAGTSILFAGTLTISGTHTLNAVDIAGTVTIAAGTTVTAAGNLTLTSGAVNTGTLAAQANINAQVGFTGGGTATLLINGGGAQTLTGFHNTAAGSLPNLDINKSSGTLTLAGTIRTARNWTHTAGTMSVGGSTVIFNGTQTVTGSHTLDIVDVRGGTLTIAVGTTLTVTGPLNLFSGGLNTGTLAAQGNVDAQVGFTSGGTGTLLINGGGAQTLTGFHNTAAGSLPNVDINKSTGTLTIAGTLRTARNWTYTSGGLTVAGSTVIFNGTLTVSGDHALNDVQLRSGDVTVTVGNTLNVGGLLTLTDGNLEGGTIQALGNIDLLGTFDGETGTILIAGTGAQTLTGSGTATTGDVASIVINKPSGTLLLVGTVRLTTASWTWLAGSLDPGTSLVVFDSGTTISGDHALFDVLLRGGSHIVTLGDTLTATGTLTLDNGTLDGGTIAAAGTLSQLSTFDGGTGTLEIAGGAAQTFTGSATAGVGDLPDLLIDKSGGTVTLSGTIRTTHDWTYAAGVVDPGASLVVFAGTPAIDAAGMSFADVQVAGGTTTLLSDLSVGGDLFISGGTLDLAGLTATVGGNVTVDGSIVPGTGLLVMNGAAAQTLGGVAAVIGLYDLTVSNAAGVTMTTPVSVTRTLTLNGPLSFNGTTLSIANPIAGTLTNLTGDAASSLIVTGSGSGIVVPSTLTVLLNLSTDNPNGFALAAPLTVGGTLTLAGGIVDANAGTLTIGPAGSVVRTSGHVDGPLELWVLMGSAVGVNFDIGDASTYAPVSLLFGTVSTSGTITARTTPGEHPSIATSVIDPTQDVNRWWSLTNSGSVFDIMTATFNFDPADVDPGAQTAAFVVGKWDGAWVLPISSGQTPTSITASGMTSLSEFAMGEVTKPPSPTPTPSATPTSSPSPGASGLPNTTSHPGVDAGAPILLLVLVGAMALLLLANVAARRPMLRD